MIFESDHPSFTSINTCTWLGMIHQHSSWYLSPSKCLSVSCIMAAIRSSRRKQCPYPASSYSAIFWRSRWYCMLLQAGSSFLMSSFSLISSITSFGRESYRRKVMLWSALFSRWGTLWKRRCQSFIGDTGKVPESPRFTGRVPVLPWVTGWKPVLRMVPTRYQRRRKSLMQ